jgi:hypothetical protein
MKMTQVKSCAERQMRLSKVGAREPVPELNPTIALI